MHFDALAVRRFPAPRSLAALAALLATLMALASAGVPVAACLRYERVALAHGEWWRLATAHLVHHDWPHLALNLAGLALLWMLYRAQASAREWLVVVLASMLAVDAGLYWFAPEVRWYLGASGLLHGLWAAGAVFTVRQRRLEGWLTLSLLTAKLLLEQRYGALSASSLGLAVVTAAHGYGALGGLAAALGLRARRAPL